MLGGLQDYVRSILGDHVGGCLELFGDNFGGNICRKKGSHRLFKIDLNSRFNDQGVFL